MRSLIRLLVLSVAVALVPAAGAAATPTATVAKHRCHKGYKAVKVKKHGHRRWVCRKKKTHHAAPKPAPSPSPSPSPTPSAPAGPSVADVESIIRTIAQAHHEPWLGPESIAVTFEQPTQVLPAVKYDPNAADPLNAGGAIDAWPVRAWTKIVNNHDATPADDTHYAGCDGHLDSAWPHDMMYMFFQSAAGGWTFKSTPVKAGSWDCG